MVVRLTYQPQALGAVVTVGHDLIRLVLSAMFLHQPLLFAFRSEDVV